MRLFSCFPGSHALKLAALVAVASAPAGLLLPGCSGGGNALTGGNNGPTQTQLLRGAVTLGVNQTGALDLRVFSDNSARGTFKITNSATAQRAAQATTFSTGTYNISGSYDPITGRVQVSGNIAGFGPFSLDVTPPSGTTAGSFVSNFNGETYNGTIPVSGSPTAAPTTSGTPTKTGTPSATAIPTTPTANGRVPLGTSGAFTINLTSSNSALSGGNITASVGSTANVSQIGNVDRINIVNGGTTIPPRLFNLLITKAGGFFSGDNVAIKGDSDSSDIITLLVTNLSNPANSGVFRGQSGSFRVDSVVGKKVNYTVQNLKMVSETNSSSSFNLNGSGSFTIQ